MLKAYVIFGILGWIMEILWTGLNSLIQQDFKLTSSTSIWMFFIYGAAAFFSPICNLVSSLPVLIRGGVYVICIFTIEFITGSLMKQMHVCPWDYSQYKYNVRGVIRLDYLPLWFAAGIFFEFVYKKYLTTYKIG